MFPWLQEQRRVTGDSNQASRERERERREKKRTSFTPKFKRLIRQDAQLSGERVRRVDDGVHSAGDTRGDGDLL